MTVKYDEALGSYVHQPSGTRVSREEAICMELATSVERDLVVKHLEQLAQNTRLGSKAAALLDAADSIKKGEHR